jgi:hypothetical protein
VSLSLGSPLSLSINFFAVVVPPLGKEIAQSITAQGRCGAMAGEGLWLFHSLCAPCRHFISVSSTRFTRQQQQTRAAPFFHTPFRRALLLLLPTSVSIAALQLPCATLATSNSQPYHRDWRSLARALQQTCVGIATPTMISVTTGSFTEHPTATRRRHLGCRRGTLLL